MRIANERRTCEVPFSNLMQMKCGRNHLRRFRLDAGKDGSLAVYIATRYWALMNPVITVVHWRQVLLQMNSAQTTSPSSQTKHRPRVLVIGELQRQDRAYGVAKRHLA